MHVANQVRKQHRQMTMRGFPTSARAMVSGADLPKFLPRSTMLSRLIKGSRAHKSAA